VIKVKIDSKNGFGIWLFYQSLNTWAIKILDVVKNGVV
jgi:hypothetical protein